MQGRSLAGKCSGDFLSTKTLWMIKQSPLLLDSFSTAWHLFGSDMHTTADCSGIGKCSIAELLIMVHKFALHWIESEVPGYALG